MGNLDSKRDWGYAKDYVEAMWMILQHKEPQPFVIATNESHSVGEFAEKAFDIVGLDSKDFVKVDKRYFRPADVNYLCGDYSRAKEILGWEPKTKFNDLVELMMNEDLERWERWKSGEHFPWDAFNYPNENNISSRMLQFDK